VKKDREEGGGPNRGPEFFDLFFIERRIFPPPWVSGEELYGLAAPEQGSFDDP
jgi:hypothetical protein